MPFWLLLAGIGALFIGFGTLIDFIYKKNAEIINTDKLSAETKDNFGSSSYFM